MKILLLLAALSAVCLAAGDYVRVPGSYVVAGSQAHSATIFSKTGGARGQATKRFGRRYADGQQQSVVSTSEQKEFSQGKLCTLSQYPHR